jgi:hypothetical protein
MRIGMAIAALGLAAVAGRARADAAEPELYLFDQPDAGTVLVTVHNYQHRTCPDDGLLRRKVGSDEVVKITSCDASKSPATFVDQCVPAGEYQYGLATPLTCTSSTGTERYGTVTVSPGAAEGCTRATDVPAPEPASTTEVEGWAAGPVVCAGHYDPFTHGCSTGGAVLGVNAAVLAAGLALWRRRSCRRA